MAVIVSSRREVMDKYLCNQSIQKYTVSTYGHLGGKPVIRQLSNDIATKGTAKKNGVLMSASQPDLKYYGTMKEIASQRVIPRSPGPILLKRRSLRETSATVRGYLVKSDLGSILPQQETSVDSTESLDESVDFKSCSPPQKQVIFNVGSVPSPKKKTTERQIPLRQNSAVFHRTGKISEAILIRSSRQERSSVPSRRCNSFCKLPKSILKTSGQGESGTSPPGGLAEVRVSWAELAQMSGSEDSDDEDDAPLRSSYSPDQLRPKLQFPQIRRTQSLTAAVPDRSYAHRDKKLVQRNSLFSLFSCSKEFAEVLDKIVLSSDDEKTG